MYEVVIASITQGYLPDGGVSIFARTIELLRRQDLSGAVESFFPDLRGLIDSLKITLYSSPLKSQLERSC